MLCLLARLYSVGVPDSTVPQISYISSTTLNVHFIPVSVAADSSKPACQQETNYLHQLVLKHEIAKEHLVSVFFLWLGKTHIDHLGVNQTGLCLDNTYSVDLDGRPVWSFLKDAVIRVQYTVLKFSDAKVTLYLNGLRYFELTWAA